MKPTRQLIVTADDFGIGPHTTQGILELAVRGRISATVLLANSPYAYESVVAWNRAARPVELGWHPCLTLDRPVRAAEEVPSLVDRHGRFWSLGKFLFRLRLGRIKTNDILAELRGQYARFIDLVGGPPALVNSHHHISIFAPIGDIVRGILKENGCTPYCRAVIEPWNTLRSVPGNRIKRMMLTRYGKRDAGRAARQGFPTNDALIGVTNAQGVQAKGFYVRRLLRAPGQVVELTCHPGRFDRTLLGRDCTENDGQLQRRVREYALLEHASFRNACRRAGLTMVPPSALQATPARRLRAA